MNLSNPSIQQAIIDIAESSESSMVPEIGSTYIVQSIDMTRSAANPDRFLVTVQLKVVAADEADTKSC